MSDLAIIVFEGRHTADEALLRLAKMDQEWEANLDDVAVLTRDKDGVVRLRESHGMMADGFFGGGALGGAMGLLMGAMTANPAAGLLGGAIGGATGGMLGGALSEVDAEDEFVAKVGQHMKPDSSALAVIGWTSRPTKMLNELEGLNGKVIETSLSVSDEKALREVLEKNKG